MNDSLLIKSLFSLDETLAKDYMEEYSYPWEVLIHISEIIISIGNKLDESRYDRKEDNVWIAKNANVYESAFIKGPCIIGENTEVRHCAFIRGNVLVGSDCVVGNSTEIKNSILFNNVQAPHYNYIGDSILGYGSHMGAGSITSNIKSDKSDIVIRHNSRVIETGRRKIGAFIGDKVEVGCGAVLNPGSIIGRNTIIYPLSFVRGYVEENSIYKKAGEVVIKNDYFI